MGIYWLILDLDSEVVFNANDIKIGVLVPCVNMPRRFLQIFDISIPESKMAAIEYIATAMAR